MPNPNIKKLSAVNTKKEMLDAYEKLAASLEEKKQNEIKASEQIEEKKVKTAISLADSLSAEIINKKIAELRFEFGSTLSKFSEKIEEEFDKYVSVKNAVAAKEKELNEIFEIQKSAQSLYALIEAQKLKKAEFDQEMEDQEAELEAEMEEKRETWEKEKAQKEAEIKEKDKHDQALRTREKEEYTYNFQREQQLARDKFETEKTAMEKGLAELTENSNKDLAEREKSIKESEAELKELRVKVAGFPDELSSSIDKAVKDATAKIIMQDKHNEEMLISKFEGEKRALDIKIESLEKNINEQNNLLAKYSTQIEKSYVQIQDIATKAVSSSQNRLPQIITQAPAKEG